MKSRIQVKIRPRAKHPGVRNKVGDCVRIDVQSPPVDGRANREVIEIIARLVGVPISRVHIVLGKTRGLKLVEIDGVSQEELDARLQ
jgi:hypothetical protein